MMRSFTWTDDV